MIDVVVPGLLAVILAVIGILHLVWAFTPWPWRDKVTFSKTLYGSDSGEMPPPLLSGLVGCGLLGAGLLTLMVNGTIAGIGPDWLQVTGMTVFAVIMLARGAGGYLMNSGAAAEFQLWNSRLYSPLCLVLCLLSTTVVIAAVQR